MQQAEGAAFTQHGDLCPLPSFRSLPGHPGGLHPGGLCRGTDPRIEACPERPTPDGAGTGAAGA